MGIFNSLLCKGPARFLNNIFGNLVGTVNGFTIGKSVPADAKFTDTITTASTTGSGNAVTAVAATNGALTVTKGTTFLTSHQDISGKADKSATVSTVAWDTTNKKITKTINGSTTDVVTGETILGGLTKTQVTTALGYTPPTSDTNTHRPIQVNGTEVLGNNTTALNLKAGSNVTVTNSSGTVTIAATDTTYTSKAAASGGTDVSLVTTGEKATWNAKTSNVGTITGITMNGSSKGTSGVVDLGTVITAHQDISGKADKSATVSTVTWDSTNKKLTKTINGTTSDVVTGATILGGLTKAQVTTALGYTPPTTDTNTTYTLTQDSTDGHKITFTPSSGTATTITIPDNNTNNAVTQTATTTNADYEVLFSATADNTTRTEGARKNTNMKFNPSTGNLTVTQLNGADIGSSPKFTDTNTTYSSGTGLSLSGTTFNHSNSVTAQTTQAIYPIEIDSEGHISAYGSAVTPLTSHQTIKQDGMTGATINRYGVCNTAASTSAKTASITSGSILVQTGTTVYIKFTHINTASNPTLSINNSAAKPIMRYDTTPAGTTPPTSWVAGAIVQLTYDGTNWIMNSTWDNNTTYSVMSVEEGTAGTATSGRLLNAANLKEIIDDRDFVTSSDLSDFAYVNAPRYVNLGSISSLPGTWTVTGITTDMVCSEAILGNPSAQTGDWTVNTDTEGQITVSGSISGTTTVTLLMAPAISITGVKK